MDRLLRQSDVVLALGVVAIIAMLIIPLPTGLLDLLLVLNLSVALTVLLLTMYARRPLDFSVFPSLLLIVTLFRLALNVSASRLILLQANAGEVINAFGNFVVGGNYVVGIVVFLILVIIQFVVITNGASRVAEVAARFTLDAMPGKQMGIDADLNAGIINEDQARRRRQGIEMEADFYGAMDGASKFVRGDAIAGIVIVAVNIIGGFAIGVAQRGMDLTHAAQTYTILTVGDGLVTQIPALMVSTAAGILVTRAASDSHLGEDTLRQLISYPRMFAILGALLLAFGFVPGLPRIPFMVLGGLMLLIAIVRWGVPPPGPEEESGTARRPESGDGGQQLEQLATLLQVDPLEVEIGYDLIPLVDPQASDNLLDRIGRIRRQLATELGILVPTIRVRDNLQLEPTGYAVKLRGVGIASGNVYPHRQLALSPNGPLEPLEGIQTVEPAFGLAATWIPNEDRARAELLGYTVVDPLGVLTTHLTEILRAQAPALLGRGEVQKLLNNVRAESPNLVDDLIPTVLTVAEVQQVLQGLLRERVSIRDLVMILEALANRSRGSHDIDALTEIARQALGRSIGNQFKDEEGVMHCVTLGPYAERQIAAAIETTERGLAVALEPQLAQSLISQAVRQVESLMLQGKQPVLLCSTRVRLALRRLTERALASIPVMAYGEIPPEIQAVSEGTVELEAVEVA
ncbi:MAG: flagellar biosynthesis protein FlhA [Chloroflexi bacterium]|nr:flagellar biosynthesis protein FlhA [Chloroflexota bacterium]